MSASIKSFLVMLCILPLILFISTQISDDDYVYPIVFVVLVLGFAFKQVVASNVRFDAFVLGVLTFGYIVANRGFASIGPSATVPLFVGEAGMVACLLYLVGQQIIHHQKFLPTLPLARILAAFLVYAGVRLVFNFQTFGLTAVRDSAMVYYAVFFFIAYQAGQDEVSREFFMRTLVRAAFFLVPVGLISRFAPSVFEAVTLRGIPIIYQKGDLLCIFCSMSAVILYCLNYHTRWPRLIAFGTVVCIGLMLLLGARAGFVSLVVPMVFLAIARMNRLVFYLAGLVAVAVVSAVIYVQVTKAETSNLEIYNLYEKYLATLDPNAEFEYQSSYIGASSAQNNQFRLVWWKTVINDTIEQSPWIGLGFGYDLTEHFVQVYFGYFGADVNDTRSPHCYFVSAFGRLGLIGLIFSLAICIFVVRGCYRAAIAVRHGHGDRRRLALWLGALSIFTGATFGVVLEGPMGGIVFWCLMGMACVYDKLAAEEEPLEDPGIERLPLRGALADRPMAAHHRGA